MTAARHVLVVIPARDEEERIAACIASVRNALARARRVGLVERAVVVVVAHRCADRTADRAREALGDAGWVVHDWSPSTVGQVRERGVRIGLESIGSAGPDTWVLSTDADTVVPPTWVAGILAEADVSRAVAVVGMADLDRWEGSDDARAAYEALIRAGMREPTGLFQHAHVYAANLAVRADAFVASAGFGEVAVGEDHHLVASLVERGARVLRTTTVRVRTSARPRGRAAGGLGDLLGRLETTPEPVV